MPGAVDVAVLPRAKLAIFGIVDVHLAPHSNRVDDVVQRCQAHVADGADVIELRWPVFREEESDPVDKRRTLLGRVVDRLAVPVAVRCQTADLAKRLVEAGASMLVTQGLVETTAVAPVVAGTPVGLLVCPSPGPQESRAPDPATTVASLVSEMADLARAARASGVASESLLVDPSEARPSRTDLILHALPRILDLGFRVAVEPGVLAQAGPVLDQGRWEAEGAIASLAVASGATVLRVHDVRRLARVGRMADAIVRSALE